MKTCTLFLLVALFSIPLSATETNTSTLFPSKAPYESPLNAAIEVQYTPTNYSSYDWANGQTVSRAGHGVRLGLEWLPFGDWYGKLGIGLGLGAFMVNNVGLNRGSTDQLNTYPIESYLSYRFDYLQGQWLVPFVKAGASIVFSTQSSKNGGGKPGVGHYHGFDYGAGMEFLMNVLDPHAGRMLDSQLGVNGTYLVFEFVRSQRLGRPTQTNLSRDEYRLGLRFEI